VSSAERNSHFAFAVLMVFCAGIVALACSGGGPAPDGNPLAPGDTRFLIARGNGIEEITLSGQAKRLFELQDRSYVLQPSISPDGKNLAFIAEIPARTGAGGLLDFGADLYVSNRDGGDVRPVLLHSRVGEYLEAPDWLDSRTLLVGVRGLDVVRSQTFSRILKIDVMTGEQSVFLEDGVMGAVSRDRGWLVYAAVDPRTRAEQLTVRDLKDGSQRVIVPQDAGLGLFSATAFSPDGRQIAFAAVDLRSVAPPPSPPGTMPAARLTHPFAQDVWLVNRDGSGLKRLGETAENMPGLTWSGESSHIYVIGPAYLWRVDPVAATAEQVRESGDRAWIVWIAGP
jgi:Tol biopolymer transport system component